MSGPYNSPTPKLPFLLVLLLMLTAPALHAQRYKEMMDDTRINFYTVCDSADAYFRVHGSGKGSGYAPYQRWRYLNESRYAPSGDRSQVDPYFVDNAVQAFLQNTATYRLFFPSGWKELGPLVVGSVTGHYSVGLGRVEDFWADPAMPQRLYLGSRSGGFWRSSDGGTTWAGTTDFLPASGCNAIAVSPTNPDSILINVRHADNGYTRGVYRSTDGGLTWAVTNFNPTTLGWGGLGSSAWINFIKYHPTLPGVVFIGGSRGLFRSNNNLSTWTQLYVNGDVDDIEFHPTNPNIFYVYDAYGPNNHRNEVMVTTNGGSTFTWSGTLTGNANEVAYFETSPACPNCLFAASSNGYWRSTDMGTSFTFVSDPPAGCFGGFAVGDTDTSKVLAGYLDSFFSNDGGRNFSQITYWSWGNASYNTTGKYVHADLRDAECINGVFYVATDGFLCKSTDNGVNWSILSDGTGIRENYCVAASQSNYDRSICGSQDNGTSIKVQGTWVEFYGADGMDNVIHPLNDDWMIGSTQNGGRRRTQDGGLSGQNVAPTAAVNATWVAPQLIDPNAHMTVYSYSELVHRSTDFGSTWTTLGNPGFGGGVDLAVIAENNSQVMVVSRGAGIKKSTDGGMTFSSIGTGLPGNGITDLAFNPRNDNHIVATYNSYQNNGNKVYLTTNQGTSWQNITYNLGNIPVLSVAIDHQDDPIIYVGTELGVYAKAMSATTWLAYNPGLPNVAVRDLDIMYGANTLRAASWGRGLWEFSLLNRNTFPAITRTTIDNPPTDDSPKSSVSQYVTAVIDYDSTLTSVYVEWSLNAPTFGNVIPMSLTGGSTWRSNSPLPDGPAGTKVYFKVYAVGAQADTTVTYKFMYTLRPFVYCNAAGGTNTGSDYISLVHLRNLHNPSGQNYYGNFTGMAADLRLDSTYTLEIKMPAHFSQDIAAAWIDFDRDASFEANEAIAMGPYNGAHQSIGTFTVPHNAHLNDTVRLRVRNYYGTGQPSPCGTQTGEVEDYSIVIRCNNSATTLSASACGSYQLNAQTYTSSGTYTQVLTNATGCDSTLTLNLDIRNATAGVLNASTCAPSYTLNSQSYTASGVYTQTLTNAAGCDSTLTLNLTLLQPSASSLSANACDSYTLNGQTYTASGVYTQMLTNAAGCDSTLTLTLVVTGIDTGVTVGGSSLTAQSSVGSFQWIDCGTQNSVPGAVQATFTPTQTGNYAVVVTDGACSDTSACYLVTVVGIEGGLAQQIRLSPNPTTGILAMDFGGVMADARIQILNALGQEVAQVRVRDAQVARLDIPGSAGVYIVRVAILDGQQASFKVVKRAE